MDEAEVPAEVQWLLREAVTSYEEITVLVLLACEPSVSFTVGSVSERLRMSAALVGAAFQRLHRNGLVLNSRGESGDAYCFEPGDARLARSVELLMVEYRDNWLGVVKLITANAIERMHTQVLRVFADAFVLRPRKDRKDG